MAYCKWCGSSIDACYGQCEGAKKARMAMEGDIVRRGCFSPARKKMKVRHRTQRNNLTPS